jgi:hypothetical protein
MGWKNNLKSVLDIDADELAAAIVKEMLAEDIVFDGEEWWLDEVNDPRELLLSYQCSSKDEPIYAKQARIRVHVEVVSVPDEVTIIE